MYIYIYIADSPENSSECEEIDATQVIIHDSTPKTPVIQRRNQYVSKTREHYVIPSMMNICNLHLYLSYNSCANQCIYLSLFRDDKRIQPDGYIPVSFVTYIAC